MISMHYFSSQDLDKSLLQSSSVLEFLDEASDKILLNNEELIQVKDEVLYKLNQFDINRIVRKSAHFFMYAIIGGLMMIVVHTFSEKVFLSAVVSFELTVLFAVYDEIRQFNADGRTGSISDVFIDACGAFISIGIICLIYTMSKRKKIIL